MELINLSCEGFLEELASKAAAPGGGGASALVGAAGVALGSMVGSLTVGKKKYAAVEADIIALNVRRGPAQRLEVLVQADAEAFRLLRRPTSCRKRPRNSRPTRPRCWKRHWTEPAPCRWR